MFKSLFNAVRRFFGLDSVNEQGNQPVMDVSYLTDDRFSLHVQPAPRTSGNKMSDMVYQVLFDENLPLQDRLEFALFIRSSMLNAMRDLLEVDGMLVQPSTAMMELEKCVDHNLSGTYRICYPSMAGFANLETLALMYGWLGPAGDLVSFATYLTTGDSNAIAYGRIWCMEHGFVRIAHNTEYSVCVVCTDEYMKATYGFDEEDNELDVLVSDLYCPDCGAYIGKVGDPCSHCTYLDVTENLKFNDADDESNYVPRA